jgi:hypothetical protein
MQPSEVFMLWKQMNAKQQAFLNTGSSGVRSLTLKRFAVNEDQNSFALAKRTAHELERDAERKREREARESMLLAIASFDGQVRKIEPTKCMYADGARGMWRPKAGAMNMRYFKGSSFGC